MNLQKFIIFSTLFLDMIGIAIIIPAFPELKAFYHITDFQITLWLTVYSLGAFLSAPLLWQISDKIGRKKPLLFCILGTLMSYLVLLVTQQYWVFLLSRVINGITGGNISILQAILTDISPDQETKNKNFWLMWAIFWLWFIIGPLVGALLLRFWGINAIFAFGAWFGLIEFILILAHFANTNTPEPTKVLTYNTFNVIHKYVSKPYLRNFLISLFIVGTGWFIINSSMWLYMQNMFGTSGEQYGYILAVVGLLIALTMWLLVPKFWTRYFSNRTLILFAHLVMIVWYIGIWLSHNATMFVTLFYAVTLLSSYYNPIYNVQIMSKAQPHEIGELSGMLWGTQSLLMFIWPLIGGALLAAGYNIFYGATICVVASLAVMVRYFVKDQ